MNDDTTAPVTAEDLRERLIQTVIAAGREVDVNAIRAIAADLSPVLEHAARHAAAMERLRAELAETREELDLQRDIAKTGDGWQQRAEKAEAERNALKAAIASLKDDALFVARHAEENAWPDSDVAVKARRLLTALAVPESTPDAPTGGED